MNYLNYLELLYGILFGSNFFGVTFIFIFM